MKTIYGSVIIAKTDNPSSYSVFFGQPVNQPGYENLRSNGITPFGNIIQARKALRTLIRRKDFLAMDIGRLAMSIAENEADLEQLRQNTSLIVIMVADEGTVPDRILLGPIVKGLPNRYPLPCAELGYNGFTTYDALHRALYVASEVRRQAQVPGLVASFRLERMLHRGYVKLSGSR